jgi:hypothetical protein
VSTVRSTTFSKEELFVQFDPRYLREKPDDGLVPKHVVFWVIVIKHLIWHSCVGLHFPTISSKEEILQFFDISEKLLNGNQTDMYNAASSPAKALNFSRPGLFYKHIRSIIIWTPSTMYNKIMTDRAHITSDCIMLYVFLCL